MTEEQLYERLRALSVTCPFTIEIREGACKPYDPLVTLKTNRFHWIARALVKLAIKVGQIEVFVDTVAGA